MGAGFVQCLIYRYTVRTTSILTNVLKGRRINLTLGSQQPYKELWTFAADLIPSATMKCYGPAAQTKLMTFNSTTQMPRSRRRHRTRSHSRARSHSAGSLQYEHKRRRIEYDSPQSKGTYSGERVLRSRQHDRGTSQERRYKRSHRRSPSSSRQHGHRERDRERVAHPTSSRRPRIYRHHASSSASQDRHRHRSPSSRSQVSLRMPTNGRLLFAIWPFIFRAASDNPE
ncbi:uncharacterized protein LOC143219215 isoform X1 [Lasioglossum baleicum]|uniref:uncharacterized protein LOC143219215 isoform X1 n=1 Tax=Lasioglossum baleicum TaxID=434251 RepID=UPI003FCE60B4